MIHDAPSLFSRQVPRRYLRGDAEIKLPAKSCSEQQGLGVIGRRAVVKLLLRTLCPWTPPGGTGEGEGGTCKATL